MRKKQEGCFRKYVPRIAAVLLLGWLLGCSSAVQPPQDTPSLGAAPALLPQPQALALFSGQFRLNDQTTITLSGHQESLRPTAQFLAEVLQASSGLSIRVSGRPPKGAPSIELKLTPDLGVGAEGYHLTVHPNSILAQAKTEKGLFWAVQTLRQLVELQLSAQTRYEQGADLLLPAVQIKDEPAFAWRGFMLDVSRHFMSKDLVKRYIDLLSFYKLNTLHLHLSDDQGWRLEVPAYPALTNVGAWRQSPAGQHGGFYTAQDIQELVAYARQRHVTLVPEIDVPGHTQALLAAYPELSCTGGPFTVSAKPGVHPDILCAGNEKTYAFLDTVFAQVARQFPGEYVHLGGDEAPKERWKACPKCQKRMKAEGLPDEEALQGYFTRRVIQILQRHQKKPVAWDEVLKGGIGKEVLVQSWHGEKTVKQAAAKGASVLVSPRSSFYLDLNSGITSVAKVYETAIIPNNLPQEQHSLIWGAEAALWTEDTPQQKADQMVFPRLLAFAENVWQAPGQPKNYDAFQQRLRAHYPFLDRQGVRYGFETWPVKINPSYSLANDMFSVSLEPGLPHVELRYTLDGTVPGPAAKRYTGQPIQFATSATLRVVPFKAGETWHEPVQAVFVKHAALHKTPVLTTPAHPAYSGGSALALTDGILGDDDYRKGFWQGFEEKDLDATLDLGQEKAVQEIRIRFLQDMNSWIFLPAKVEFWVAGEDQKFEKASSLTHQIPLKQEKPVVKEFSAVLAQKKIRYLKVKAQNIGKCPPGHPGAGGGAFLMADEIIVR